MKKEIFEIFPEKKQAPKNTKPVGKIIIDYREKNSFVAVHLLKLGFEIEFKELKVADYLAKDVAIERKTISDFLSSMMNKRLTRQIEELKQYPNRLILVEGFERQELYNEDNSKINPNAIRGFLLSIALKHKIPLIFTKNEEDTAKFISVIAKKQEKEMSLNVRKKSLSKKEQLQFILEGFPGIGPKTAKKLLQEFKTIKNIINLSEGELKKILRKKSGIFQELILSKY